MIIERYQLQTDFELLSLEEVWENPLFRHVLLKDNALECDFLNRTKPNSKSEQNVFEQLKQKLIYVTDVAVMKVTNDHKKNTKIERKIKEMAQISVQEIKQNLTHEYRLFYLFGKSK